MKKVVSVILTCIMLFSMAIPTFAATINPEETKSQIPVIRVLGDGEPMYDAEGNKLFHIRTSFSEDNGNKDEDGEESKLIESVANVLLPFLIKGLLNDDWDDYYKNLEKEIGELTGDAKLDCNGDPVEGTGISQKRQEFIDRARKTDKKNEKGEKTEKGYYGLYDYHFWYDWRLDPLYNADLLNEYIKDVKKATKCSKVAINASCIGTIVTTAYVAKYGVDDIQGIGYTGSLASGAEFFSEAISGKFDVNSEAISRVLADSAYLGLFNLDSFVSASLELLLKSGVIEFFEKDIRENLYGKIAKGVTSALALSTLFTYPSYWAAVSTEDYEDALLYVFGEPGSEKRQQYAGLIEKIENYNTLVRKNLNSIIKSIGEGGANFGAIAKYGFQILPICESYNVVSDQFVSVNHASFGATTSTIYDTLSDAYIAERVEKGFGKYISPDKQIDASTSLYPNSTWFVKNSSHSEYTAYEKKILYDVSTADRQLTPEDFPWSQFMVYDYDTDTMTAMTKENSDTEQWEPSDKEDEKPSKLLGFLTALINWIVEFFKKIF